MFPFRRRAAPGLVPRQFRRDAAIFIHVPKCAGSALLDAWIGFQTGHVTAEAYHAADPAFFGSAYVFTFVRDPLARFVSAYDHIDFRADPGSPPFPQFDRRSGAATIRAVFRDISGTHRISVDGRVRERRHVLTGDDRLGQHRPDGIRQHRPLLGQGRIIGCLVG